MRLSFPAISLFLLGASWAQTTPPQPPKPLPTLRASDLKPEQVRDIVNSWPECDEYRSANRCKVSINMSAVPQIDPADRRVGPWMPRAHWDVQVKPFVFLTEAPRGEAVIVLQKSSPFLQCTVQSTPSAPARDLSANIATLLTAVGSMGAIPLAEFSATASTLENRTFLDPLRSVTSDLSGIEDQLIQIDTLLNGDNTPYRLFRKAIGDDWKYTFADEPAAAAAIADLKAKAAAALAAPPPDFAGLQRQLNAISRSLQALIVPPDLASRAANDRDLLTKLLAQVTTPAEAEKNEEARRKTIRQIFELLWGLKGPYTMQVLPMAYYSGKQVTETLTCKDAVTNNPAFENIAFTAFYEGVPHFDVSAGAILSLLGGRQAGALTGAWTPTQANACTAAQTSAPAGATPAPCGPPVVLGYTTRSNYQFMPGVFAEWRIINFLPKWVRNGSPVHKLGYLWSFGPAGGLNINPNNGTTTAEFFTGVSLGIQRIAIMVGYHAGRYQEFGGGYYAGETFPTGTTITPLTVRDWAWHPAFGIAYRIPIR